MQVGILNGVYADATGDFRTSYPRNMIPVPKQQGISKGYLRPPPGIEQVGTGPGIDRGGYNWNGICYRVMGTKLVKVDATGAVAELGDVGSGGQVTMDNGVDRLAIWSGGGLYYWNGSTLTKVTDPDLGTVIDGRWIAGYYLSTDGSFLIVTELADPASVNPLKYGTAESDPDPILAVDELSNEAYALGRYSIEVFNNVGGTGFPFQRIEGAQINKGVVGTHAYAQYAETFAFVGSGKNEAPSVYLMGAGAAIPIATREIEQVLATYTEAQLAQTVVETWLHEGHEHLLVHLPDQCLVYDVKATKVVGEPVWFTLTSSIVDRGAYRARNLVWAYDRWNVADPTSTAVGRFVDDVSTHYGATIGWDFGTMVLYNGGAGAIVFEMELVGLPGRVPLGKDPVIWTSYSLDGETWTTERAARAGRQGERNKRIAWRNQGMLKNYRIQRFRGTSDAHLSVAALSLELEGLGNGG